MKYRSDWAVQRGLRGEVNKWIAFKFDRPIGENFITSGENRKTIDWSMTRHTPAIRAFYDGVLKSRGVKMIYGHSDLPSREIFKISVEIRLRSSVPPIRSRILELAAIHLNEGRKLIRSDGLSDHPLIF